MRFLTLGADMARPSRTGGNSSAANTKASPVEGRKPTKTKCRTSATATRIKGSTVSDLVKELKEAREQQAATAEILKVIASSPDNVQPVLEAVAERTNHLVGGFTTVVWRILDDVAHLAAFTHAGSAADAALMAAAVRIPLSSWQIGETIRKGEVFSIADTEADVRSLRDLARLRGFRSVLYVPMLRNREPIGIIGVTRAKPGKFADHHVHLLQTFADQAVIAIDNTRLFNETKEALERQTATADILKVISRSAFDLQPVFDTVAESSVKLCGADRAFIFRFDGELLHMVAAYNSSPAFKEWVARNPIRPGRHSGSARAALERRTIHIPDVRADAEYTYGAKNAEAIRTVLGVPILKGDELLGVMMIYHLEVRPFTDKQMALVETFADQAAIAIENAQLFKKLQERTQELSRSLDDLRAAKDRLVQTEKLASLGQLTAGIAHEIKNPLNFVNNFSSLSTELLDELDEMLAPAPLDQKMRGDVGELTQMLKSNLEKVAQHGKRADSIVKNMLLHSREGSGEHRSADINIIVEDSLNLAFHGARAEKSGFTITLRHDLDPRAGAVELYPQEITRALLNLISNGFYAATKRKAESGDESFEPILSASTRNLGKAVEIRIRDNGSGIPPDVREKMFNPFFTTKPTGEGTGLGLSMTHDIIVKQHGGWIDVETEPGAFTEFIITLPRDNGTAIGEKSE